MARVPARKVKVAVLSEVPVQLTPWRKVLREPE